MKPTTLVVPGSDKPYVPRNCVLRDPALVPNQGKMHEVAGVDVAAHVSVIKFPKRAIGPANRGIRLSGVHLLEIRTRALEFGAGVLGQVSKLPPQHSASGNSALGSVGSDTTLR